MLSFLAVVFFCAGDQCYFWSGKTLHSTESACQRELSPVVSALEKEKAAARFQCLKVPLTGA